MKRTSRTMYTITLLVLSMIVGAGLYYTGYQAGANYILEMVKKQLQDTRPEPTIPKKEMRKII